MVNPENPARPKGARARIMAVTVLPVTAERNGKLNKYRWRGGVFAAVLAVLVGTFTAATPANAAQLYYGACAAISQGIDPTDVIMYGAYNGEQVGVEDTSDNSPIYVSFNDENWCFQPLLASDGTAVDYNGYPIYRIKNYNTGLCIDILGDATSDGTRAVQYACKSAQVTTGASQEWALWTHELNNRLAGYGLINVWSGTCLDDTGWGGYGTPLQIWGCKTPDSTEGDSTWNQVWQF